MLLNGLFPMSSVNSKSLNRLFNDLLPAKANFDFTTSYLPIDARDDGDSIVIQADVAGIKKEDIDIIIENGNLSISCNKQHNSEIKDESFFCKERQYGKSSRLIALPYEVDDKNTQAQLANGVLTIIIPKGDGAKKKKISIS